MESTYKPTANDNKDSKNRAENMDNYDEFVTYYRSIIGSCMHVRTYKCSHDPI